MVPHNSTILPCRSRFVKPMGGMFRKYSEYGRGPGKNGPFDAKNRPCEGRFGRGSGPAEAGKEAAEEGAGGDCGKAPDEQTEEEAARYDNRCAIAKEKGQKHIPDYSGPEKAGHTVASTAQKGGSTVSPEGGESAYDGKTGQGDAKQQIGVPRAAAGKPQRIAAGDKDAEITEELEDLEGLTAGGSQGGQSFLWRARRW